MGIVLLLLLLILANFMQVSSILGCKLIIAGGTLKSCRFFLIRSMESRAAGFFCQQSCIKRERRDKVSVVSQRLGMVGLSS